jgi:glycosyltransferase involved in cell wall biosynthesis
VIKILYIGNRLSKHGFTPTGAEYLGTVFEKGGFPITFASDKKNIVARLLDMIHAVATTNADVILIDTYSSMAFYYAVICGWLARMRGIPYIPVLRGGDILTRARTSRQLLKTFFDSAVRVVSVSRYLQANLLQYKTAYIPNTIDILRYPYKQRKHLQFRLLWVRSLHKLYNPELAVRVVKLLSTEFPEVNLTMVGPDKDGSTQRVQKLALDLGVSEKVKLIGKLSKQQWIKLSEQFDIFLNTTNFDNMPVSVTEAMALGLPVISTNVGGVPYLIDHQQDGILVPPDDAEAFVAQIIALRKNPEGVQALTKKARQKVERFDNSIVLEQWKNLLHESLSQRS